MCHSTQHHFEKKAEVNDHCDFILKFANFYLCFVGLFCPTRDFLDEGCKFRYTLGIYRMSSEVFKRGLLTVTLDIRLYCYL